MPFKSLTPNDPTGVLRRVALMGPPNSWKSATLVSDTPTPRRIVSIPGEKGWETLRQAPDTIVDVWELGDLTAASPHQVVREIDEHVNRVICDIVAKKDPTFLKVYAFPVLLLILALLGWDVSSANIAQGWSIYLGYAVIVTVSLYLYLVYLDHYLN